MEGSKINQPKATHSLGEMINTREGLEDEDKKVLLKLAQAHKLTTSGIQEVFDILDKLPSPGEPSTPEWDKAVDKASQEAADVFGEFILARGGLGVSIEEVLGIGKSEDLK